MLPTKKLLISALGLASLVTAGVAQADHERAYTREPAYVERPYDAPQTRDQYYEESGRYFRDRNGRWQEKTARGYRNDRDNPWPHGVEPRAQGDIPRGTGKDYDPAKDVGQYSGG